MYIDKCKMLNDVGMECQNKNAPMQQSKGMMQGCRQVVHETSPNVSELSYIP